MPSLTIDQATARADELIEFLGELKRLQVHVNQAGYSPAFRLWLDAVLSNKTASTAKSIRAVLQGTLGSEPR